MVSRTFKRQLLQVRADGTRQFEIARQAGVHPTVLSALVNGSIPVRVGDRRILAVGRVLGLDAAQCFQVVGAEVTPGTVTCDDGESAVSPPESIRRSCGHPARIGGRASHAGTAHAPCDRGPAALGVCQPRTPAPSTVVHPDADDAD